MIFIGLDPGANTGLATWDSDKEDLYIYPAMDFWSAVDEVFDLLNRAVEKGANVKFYIEAPHLNNPVFPNKLTGRKRDRYAMNVGSNKRDGKLWIALAEMRGWDFVAVQPTTSKWSKKKLETITGYTGQSSEHGRDAAKIIFGRRGS